MMGRGADVPRVNVGILIFEDVEVLDFCGPFEVFSITTVDDGDGGGNEVPPYAVHVIAERPDVVCCRNGLLVQPHFTIDEHPRLEIVVVPGGRGTRREVSNPRILGWIREQRERARLVTSVCTGAFLLAASGLLDGRRATTHWASVARLREQFPAIKVVDDERWVAEGDLITSAGVSAGIDMALHVVERMYGAATARQTARNMEYDGWS